MLQTLSKPDAQRFSLKAQSWLQKVNDFYSTTAPDTTH